jgi:aminoglycoside phosphotransferase (APT) family kinase protein
MASLDPDMVRKVVESQFPQLAPANVAYLGEGYDSTAFAVNGTAVFRFPKRADVEAQLLIERRVLPLFAERSPIPLPAYCFHGRPTAAFPRHFGGYPRLPGVPGLQLGSDWRPSPAATAALGQFLSTLHAFPIDEAARLGVTEEPIETALRELEAEALDGLASVSRVAPDAPLDAWRAYLEAGLPVDDAAQPRRSLVHNDLAAEHILCDPDERTVTGVIDWSDIAIGDPAADFAGMFHWGGEALVNRVLAHYDGQVDDALVARARFMAACRGVADVIFGLETERREYVEGGLRALQLCARS